MAQLQSARSGFWRWRPPPVLCAWLLCSLQGVAGRGGSDPKKPPDETLSQLFEALGLEDDGPENDSIDQKALKAAHRAASLKYHPDKNPDAKDAKARFNAIRHAYEILSDPVKTLLYDTGGQELVQKYEADSQDLKHTADKEFNANIKLEELYNGGKQSFRLSKKIVCRSCRTRPQLARCKKCSLCPSTRQVKQFIQNGRLHRSTEDITSPERCYTEAQTIDLVVEKGMMNGDTVVFHGMAGQLPNQVPGDVSVKISVAPHRFFRRVGNDLEVTLQVSLYDALLGFEREVVHLNGHLVKFSVERGMVLKPEAAIEIEGEGMPLRDDPDSFGRLVVRFEIQFPSEIPPNLQASLADALSGSGQNPLPKRVDYRGPVTTAVLPKKHNEL